MTSKKFYDDKDGTILRGSCLQKEKGAAANAVSYTHLTLPTN